VSAPTLRTDKRPSHELLMQAQELLSQARDVEREAGNRGVAMLVNDMALHLFQIVLVPEIDELANRACDERYSGGAW
jgi:hypothetical protein